MEYFKELEKKENVRKAKKNLEEIEKTIAPFSKKTLRRKRPSEKWKYIPLKIR